jgi:hypothetical protein
MHLNKETEIQLNVRRLIGLFILLVGPMLFTGKVWADSWQHAVSSRISIEYETNPAMIPANPGSVRRTLFEPSYTLVDKIGANELEAGLALQIARSTNHTLSPNREDPSVFFDWSYHSDAGELAISSRYAEIATRYAGIDATRPVPVSSTRASRTFSGRWSKELSERSSLSADGSFEGVSYTGGGNYVDYSTGSGGLRLSHAFSELSTTFLRLSGDRYVPAGGGPPTRHAIATLGLEWKVEYMDWSMQLGKYKGGGNTGLEGGATVHYTGQQTQLALNANRQISSSGLGGFVKVDQLAGNWNYALSERSNIGMDLQWWKNLSTTFYNIRTTTGVWLQHNLSPSWVGRMNYLHNILTGGGVFSASSNIIGVSLIYTNSDF